MSNLEKKHPFGKVRTLLWPIHGHEHRKLIPMLLILFLICFNYSILRNVKDTIVITADQAGAQVIPFIKVWVLLPMAFLLTWVYTFLASRFTRLQVFGIIVTGFVSYFLLFALFLYPSGDLLHPTRLCNYLQDTLPIGASGFIAMIRYWTYTLFYVTSELWTSLVMSVLFWGFANEVTKLKQASRFYGPLNVASSIAAFIAGQTAIFFTRNALHIPIANTAWESSFMTLIIIVAISAVITFFIYFWLQSKVINKEQDAGLIEKELLNTRCKNGKKKRLSLRESFKYLFASKYLLLIAVLVVGYNLSINLIEITWKSSVKSYFPNPIDFNIYLNQLTSIMGIIATCSAICIPFIITKIGWTFMAVITPIVMLITALGFFAFYFGANIFVLGGLSTLSLTVFFGSANNVLTKASKYSVFDASKELAFIPLPKEARIKGKAAIDGVGSRLGKSGSSLLQQGLFIILGTLPACAPWTAGILVLIILLWILSTFSLGKLFKEASKEQKESIDITPIETKKVQLVD
jgi:ATP:ADP antiporter, AAA family